MRLTNALQQEQFWCRLDTWWRYSAHLKIQSLKGHNSSCPIWHRDMQPKSIHASPHVDQEGVIGRFSSILNTFKKHVYRNLQTLTNLQQTSNDVFIGYCFLKVIQILFVFKKNQICSKPACGRGFFYLFVYCLLIAPS